MDRLQCPVCMESAIEPVVCPSGEHVLCYDCYLGLLDRLPANKNFASCPHCRTEGNFAVVPIVVALSRTLTRTCECGEDVVQQERLQHIKNECPLGHVRCTWCGIGHQRRWHKEHMNECVRNPILGMRRHRQPSPELLGDDETAEELPKQRNAAKRARVRIQMQIEVDRDDDFD